MKTTLRSLICSLIFTVACLAANAQSNVDTLRISIGGEFASANGIFGTAVNTAVATQAASAYKYGAGISVNIAYPLIKNVNITASAGYTNFFTTSNSGMSQQVIVNGSLPNFQTIPLKVGLKWFLSKTLYFDGEVGETILANKAALYAVYSNALTWSPGVGVLVPLNKKKTYIDGGLRFESLGNFYNDGSTNSFWALHVAYAFNL